MGMTCVDCSYIALLIHRNIDEYFQTFTKGDRVRVDADMSKAKKMQKRHGGWNPKMKKVTLFLCSKCTQMYMETVWLLVTKRVRFI